MKKADLPKSKEEIKERYQKLLQSKTVTPQRRGFVLEQLLHAVLELERLEPKSSYRPKGEQIDGSFFWMGQTFLFEAKWEKNPVPASVIFAFGGKVEGKFHTSSGIFIAVNGFSKDVEETLLKGKRGSVLLFDGDDINFILLGEVTFLNVLHYKIRQAGDTGTLYARYSNVIEIEAPSRERTIIPDFADTLHSLLSHSDDKIYELLVFVEQGGDVEIAVNLLKFGMDDYSLAYRIVVLEGVLNISQIPSVINTYQNRRPLKGIIVLLDDELIDQKIKLQVDTVSKQLFKAAVPINNLFISLSEKDKEVFAKNRRKTGLYNSEKIKIQLNSFFGQVTEEYHDPDVFVIENTLDALMQGLEWDKKANCIYVDDDYYGMASSLNTVDELVGYLDNHLIDGRLADFPGEVVREMDSLDYSWEVREYLANHFYSKIRSLGWNVDDL